MTISLASFAFSARNLNRALFPVPRFPRIMYSVEKRPVYKLRIQRSSPPNLARDRARPGCTKIERSEIHPTGIYLWTRPYSSFKSWYQSCFCWPVLFGVFLHELISSSALLTAGTAFAPLMEQNSMPVVNLSRGRIFGPYSLRRSSAFRCAMRSLLP